jgi:hypothetical protein
LEKITGYIIIQKFITRNDEDFRDLVRKRFPGLEAEESLQEGTKTTPSPIPISSSSPTHAALLMKSPSQKKNLGARESEMIEEMRRLETETTSGDEDETQISIDIGSSGGVEMTEPEPVTPPTLVMEPLLQPHPKESLLFHQTNEKPLPSINDNSVSAFEAAFSLMEEMEAEEIEQQPLNSNFKEEYQVSDFGPFDFFKTFYYCV